MHLCASVKSCLNLARQDAVGAVPPLGVAGTALLFSSDFQDLIQPNVGRTRCRPAPGSNLTRPAPQDRRAVGHLSPSSAPLSIRSACGRRYRCADALGDMTSKLGNFTSVSAVADVAKKSCCARAAIATTSTATSAARFAQRRRHAFATSATASRFAAGRRPHFGSVVCAPAARM